MKIGIIAGLLMIMGGFGLIIYWDQVVQPEESARTLLVEGNLLYERSDQASLNEAISRYSKVIAQYPRTDATGTAYYNMARSYEKLKLHRLAYLNYIYILKTADNLLPEQEQEIKARLAGLKIQREQTDEGIHELMRLLAESSDKEFRGRVYTELGHAYLRTAELDRARRMFDFALSEAGHSEEAILGKARALMRLGYHHDAFDLYDYFLKYFGEFSNYTRDVQEAYLDQLYEGGRSAAIRNAHETAISFLKRLVDRFPQSPKSEDALYWIAESYYHLEQYDTALSHYAQTLANRHTGRDQDARIRRGYTYFTMKKFDLAAREFQLYIDAFPQGRHAEAAATWKDMSTRELMYRINNKTRNDDDPEPANRGSEQGIDGQDGHENQVPGSEQHDSAQSNRDNERLSRDNGGEEGQSGVVTDFRRVNVAEM